MQYNSDRPIENIDDDLLGRTTFSKQLAKAIYNYKSKDGLVIGLFGKWGTGKTSIINMTEQKILELSENSDEKSLIMKFSPWNYSDKNDLIRMFFQELKSEINAKGNEKFKASVGKALKDYSYAIELLSAVPTVSGAPLLGTSLTKVVSKFLGKVGERLVEDISLEKTRKLLEDKLKELDNKIVVIIDDIDRLTNSQIRDVFQLVKQVADFPNIIYVLSMDRDVVCRALATVHEVDGNEYLEKIIQIPFEIPGLNKSRVNTILSFKISEIIEDLVEVEYDKDYFTDVVNNCVEPYIENVRDINRVLNIFKFRYGAMYEETSLEDMLAITTLEVMEPKLYKWISINKYVLCGEYEYNPDHQDLNNSFFENFRSESIEPQAAIRYLSTLFPAFASKVKGYVTGYNPNLNIREQMRIAHSERFDLYFSFNLESVGIPRTLIKKCLYILNEHELSVTINIINSQNNSIYFLEEIESLIAKIPTDRKEVLLSVIINLQDKFENELFESNVDTLINKILEKSIVGEIETKSRYQLISNILGNATRNGLGTLASFIDKVEMAYGKLEAEIETSTEQIISLEHLEELEKIYVEKIKDISKSELIIDIPNFRIAFYIWECFDKDEAKKYIQEMFRDNINKLKFVCATSVKVRDGWKFDAYYGDYINKEKLYKMIDNIDENLLSQLTESEKMKLASIFLNYNKGRYDEFATQKEASELVKKWESEKYM